MKVNCLTVRNSSKHISLKNITSSIEAQSIYRRWEIERSPLSKYRVRTAVLGTNRQLLMVAFTAPSQTSPPVP